LSPEEDRPVSEALAEFGIAVDKDNIFCVTTGNGQKLWVCPVKDCDRMYPRQSMLKVHILSHFNVRPFRVSMYTSPGQFNELGKGKAVPLQAWTGPEGSRKLRFPDFVTTAQDGGKVVSLTHRPPLPPGNTPGTHFC